MSKRVRLSRRTLRSSRQTSIANSKTLLAGLLIQVFRSKQDSNWPDSNWPVLAVAGEIKIDFVCFAAQKRVRLSTKHEQKQNSTVPTGVGGFLNSTRENLLLEFPW